MMGALATCSSVRARKSLQKVASALVCDLDVVTCTVGPHTSISDAKEIDSEVNGSVVDDLAAAGVLTDANPHVLAGKLGFAGQVESTGSAVVVEAGNVSGVASEVLGAVLRGLPGAVTLDHGGPDIPLVAGQCGRLGNGDSWVGGSPILNLHVHVLSCEGP